MINPADIRAKFVQAFYRSEFCLDSIIYRRTQNAVVSAGELAYNKITNYTGTRNWEYFIRKSPLSDARDTFIRVAGYGQLLTEYFIAPVVVKDSDTFAVTCEMGCLANTIVSVYDHALDNRLGSTHSLLPKRLLEGLLNGSSDIEADIIKHRYLRITKVLISLIKRYVELIRQISVNNAINDEVMNIIISMYDAETSTISTEKIDENQLYLKNTYPFLLMGITPWLCYENYESDLYNWHKSWLTQIGAIFGMIDDVVDVKEDMKLGSPNHLLQLINSNNGKETKIEKLAEELIEQCISVEEQWDARLQQIQKDETKSRVFATCLYSWLGN